MIEVFKDVALALQFMTRVPVRLSEITPGRAA